MTAGGPPVPCPPPIAGRTGERGRVVMAEEHGSVTVNLDQAAQLTGRSRRLLYLYMRDGRLPFVQVGSHRRIRREDLQVVGRVFTENRKRQRRS
jgi:excisionase family DNA binding protein